MKIACLFLAGAILCCADGPEITKVEPPDWVAASQPTTLRMLLTGSNLAGVQVKPCGSLPAAANLSVSANSSYLFFDLTIPARVRPGKCAIEASSPAGRTSAPFEIVPPLNRQQNFNGFSSDDVIYLIMPDRFANGDPSNDDPAVSHGLFDRAKARYYHGGDFAGIEQRLPYLKDLGVTAIWLTPIYDNANRLNERERYANQAITDYHGYGAVDYYGVEEHFGNLESLRHLVSEAHRFGIKVIQDQVANHTGPYHPWLRNPPAADWFHGTESEHPNETWQTWTLLDPHASKAMLRGTLDGWFLNILPDLNQDNPETARYLIQNTMWWIARTGIDGIRQDTVPYVPRAFWRKWTNAIHAGYPQFRVVGEVFDQDPSFTSFFQGGRKGFDEVDTGLDSVFDFPLYYAIRHFFARHGSATELSKVAAHDSLYPDPARLVSFLGLHDVSRFLNEPGATNDDLARAFTFLFSVRGMPMIYYGDEIGMHGGDDPDNRRDFPGGWREDTRNAFESNGRTAEENKLFDHVRHLAAIRRHSAPLRQGTMIQLFCNDHTYAFARVLGDQRVLAVFHDGPDQESVRIPVHSPGFGDGAHLTDALSGLPSVDVDKGFVEIPLPARAAAIYQIN